MAQRRLDCVGAVDCPFMGLLVEASSAMWAVAPLRMGLDASNMIDAVNAYNRRWADTEPANATKIIFMKWRGGVRCCGYVGDHVFQIEPSMPMELCANMDAAFEAFKRAGRPDHFEWTP